MQTRLQMLKMMPVLGGLHDATLAFLLERSTIVTVEQGEFFFREQEPGTSLFVLEKGRVAVVKSWQGRDYPLDELGPGDCFGEMALVDLYPRSASVRALTDCTALELSATVLHELYQRDLKQFALVQMNIAREISRRLRAVSERLFQLQAQSAGELSGGIENVQAAHIGL